MYQLGTAPTRQQFILGVPLKAIYSHIIIVIQLLLRGYSMYQEGGFWATVGLRACARGLPCEI